MESNLPKTSAEATGAQASTSAAGTWDEALTAAMADVAVPPGLSNRLLAGIRDPAAAALEAAQKPQTRARRRWLRPAAAALACAASLAIAVVYFSQPTPELGSESVMEAVRAWHHHQPAIGEPLRRRAVSDDYPPGSSIIPGCVVGWRQLPAPLLDREGVVYELTGPGQVRASLYVLDLAGPLGAPRLVVNATSPLENLLTTDGQTSATWTDGSRLYVLVADGDEQTLRTLVRAPRSMA